VVVATGKVMLLGLLIFVPIESFISPTSARLLWEDSGMAAEAEELDLETNINSAKLMGD